MGQEQTVGRGKSKFLPPTNIETKYAPGSNNYRLALLLKSVIPRSNFATTTGKPITVIAPACGRLPEYDVLQSFFGGTDPGVAGQKVKVVGVDKNAEAIADSQNLSGEIDAKGGRNPDTNFEFRIGDAKDLSQFPLADVVFIENQESIHDQQSWRDIFAAGIERLEDENAVMIVTSYTQEEHDAAITLMNDLDCDVLINEYNPNCRPMKTMKIPVDDKPAIARHRNIAVIKKKPKQP